MQGLPALFTCKQNSAPVRSPPCGPPPGQSWKEDIAPLCRTHMVLLVRYDFTSLTAQFGTLSAIKLHRMSLCNIRLKAFEKSTGTANTAEFLSRSRLPRTK